MPAGGYILVGNTYSSNGDVTGGHGNSDAWVVRIDSGGTLLWQRCLGGTDDDRGCAVVPTFDGGFLVAATVHSRDGDVTGFHASTGWSSDAWLAKLNATGGLVWQRTYGGTSSDYATSLVSSGDGGYVMSGYTSSTDGDVVTNRGWSDAWVVKVNATGMRVWSRTYGGSSFDYTSRIRRTPDGGFIVAGYANSADGDVTGNHGGYDAWVFKLDAAGNLLWHTCLGGPGTESAGDMLMPAEGGFVVAGETSSTSPYVTGQHGGKDGWIVRLGADPSTLLSVPSGAGVPRDGDADGRCEDVNGNGRKDFADVVLYFNQMSWIAANEPLVAFDYNGNGRIDFADVVWLFNHL